MTCFEKEGRENIDKTLELVKRNAEELGIKKIVVASTSGFTAEKAFDTLKDAGVTLAVVGTDRGRFSSDILHNLEENVSIKRDQDILFLTFLRLGALDCRLDDRLCLRSPRLCVDQ